MTNATFPDFHLVVHAFDGPTPLDRSVVQNAGLWRNAVGSLSLARENRSAFDPRPDYWYRTERRLLVACFAKRFERCYSPADSLRQLALKTFRHFDEARRTEKLGIVELVERLEGGWPWFRKQFLEVVRELPQYGEFDQLRSRWRHLRATIQDELVDFVESADDTADDFSLGQLEPPFFKRLPWFPYLGTERVGDLKKRQKFFAGFYLTFASTNAYRVGGAMAFAPVLQNNQSTTLLDFADRWERGESPDTTGFPVYARHLHDLEDRSHYATVVELYGLLNLHRQPFFNGAADTWYSIYAQPGDKSPLPRMQRVGEATRSFLQANPGVIDQLALRFRQLVQSVTPGPALTMEGLRGQDKVPADHVDSEIEAEIRKGALSRAAAFSAPEAAAAMFHLMLDAYLYEAGGRGHPTPPPPPSSPKKLEQPKAPVEQPVLRKIELPLALYPIAQEALAYLKAGYHVLFAGPPGTGKTTVAQFAGAAWNQSLEKPPTVLLMSETPTTTVANSSWASFHTVGGLLPDESGRFVVQRGIFVDPTTGKEGDWQLRSEAIVLDEMNRADLDRCIGELYPLLTRNVDHVIPAGIPGVRRISLHQQFRILATVNDSTLDDVVFPISEGLARRFIRIEMPGAREEDVLDFLGSSASPRLEAARALVRLFFLACDGAKKLSDSPNGRHLPLGVGYFNLLRSWISGELELPPVIAELGLQEQALRVLTTALSSIPRDKGFGRLLAQIRSPGVS